MLRGKAEITANDTLSIPYRYPIDTLSIPYRYPIETLCRDDFSGDWTTKRVAYRSQLRGATALRFVVDELRLRAGACGPACDQRSKQTRTRKTYALLYDCGVPGITQP
jgi:hypothetical protein